MTVAQGTDLRLVPAALLVWAVSGVAVGLGVGGAAALTACLALAAAAGALAARRSARRRGGTLAVTAVLAVTAAALAGTVTTVQTAVREAGALARLADGQEHVRLEGRVLGDPVRVGSWGERYRVRVSASRVDGPGLEGDAAAEVLVLGGQGWGAVRRGGTVSVVGALTRSPRGAVAVAELRAAGPPELLASPGGGAAVVEVLRRGLRDATTDLPADRRGLVTGAAVGATEDVPDGLRQAMRDAGLTHVTAVSGAHFAVLAVTVLALAGAVRAPPAVRAGLLGLTALGFVHLVHGGASVSRAAAAAAVWALAILLRRPARAVPALAAGVVVLLLVDPWLARSFGFVLSVAATAAIVLLAPALVARCPPTVPRPAATVLAVPVAAQLACAPVLVLLDPVITTYAVPANVLAAPALLPATLLGLLATVLAPLAPGPAEVVARLAGVPAAWVGLVAGTAAALPGARLPWLPGVPGALALALVVVGGVTLVLRRWPPRQG